MKRSVDGGIVGLLVSSPLALALFFPLASAGLAYLRLWPMLRKALEADVEPGSGLVAVAQEAADALGLRGAVDLRLSRGKSRYHGPTVFGRWGTRPVIVLPSDLEATVEIVSDGKPNAATALTRFVLLHELSHVRNGDHQIHSWVTAFLRAMRRWPPILFLVLAAYSVFAGVVPGLIALGTVMWSSIIFTLPLFLTWQPLQRHREKVADARAASYLLPSEIQILVKPGNAGLSAVEALAAYIEFRQGLTVTGPAIGHKGLSVRALLAEIACRLRRVLKPVSLRASAGFLRRLARTHPSSEERLALLTTGELLAESRQQVSYGTAASVFASVGLAFLALLCVVAIPSALFDLPFLIAPLVVLFLAGLFTSAVLLCLPFRNATTAAAPLRVAISGLLGRSLVGGTALAAMLFLVSIPALIVAPAQGLDFVRVTARLCGLLSAGAFIISILLAMTMRCGVLLRAAVPRAASLRRVLAVAVLDFAPTAVVALLACLCWDPVGCLYREDPAWLGSTVILALCVVGDGCVRAPLYPVHL